MAEESTTTNNTTSETAAPTPKTAPRRKKGKVKVVKGKLFINATYNNTLICATDITGNVLYWSSAGRSGFKGSKKSTPYAGQRTMEDLLFRLKDSGLVEVDVFMTGLGAGRESAVRALHNKGIKINAIVDETPIPHGGVRQKKPRRL